MKYLINVFSAFLITSVISAADEPKPDFVKQVAPIFQKYCTGCHNAKDREGKLNLESFAELQKGGENGVLMLAGQADSSRLIRVLTGAAEPAMPPEGEKAPTEQEIALLKEWINAGAPGPMGADLDRKILLTPKIAPAPTAERGIISMAYSPDGKYLALGRFGTIEIQDTQHGTTVRTLKNLPGKVNAIHFSKDGKTLISASGVSGLYGRATLWNVEDGKALKEIDGHLDTLYDAELSPDGQLLATCSYDRAIILWNAASGETIRTLDGHNDAVYDVAFSSDGAVLASASGDKTIKLWKVDSGERLDTLSQPLGEQYAVAFSPDGKYFLAGGVDNRIRVWDFVSKQKPAINPLVHARFAHEGAVLALAFSPDGSSLISAAEDRTVKRWETNNYTLLESFERQSDQIVDVALPADNQRCTVARLDGTLGNYTFAVSSRSVAPPTPVGHAAELVATDSTMTDLEDREPNDQPSEALTVQVPAKIRGTIAPAGQKAVDVDVFRFTAKAGQEWMIEVNAARQKSPLDSKVEVLDAQGKPLVRMQLQALRDSYFTFRGKDSDTSDDFRVFNWEEMEINEYLYANGEVVKLWHYPRGPDSGFIVYPGRGKRLNFFDTTPLSHALGEPCYIVEPHPPGTSVLPNGLPTFLLYYENDDDAWRQWGSDSRLLFVAPSDGEYLVRISDARDFASERHKYELLIRPRKPDFDVKINGKNPNVGAGSGKEFDIQVERLDAFEGEITIDIEGLPPGFTTSAPITVQSEQTLALATINAAIDALKPTDEQAKASKIFASATIQGKMVRKEVGSLGEIKLADKPKVLVRLAAANEPPATDVTSTDAQKPLELVLAPGQTITAKVKIERNGFNERVPFGNFDSGRNLPHGVFVDNIGLNGLMIVEGQTERIFFITAAKWVPEQTRKFHVQAQVEGNQTSLPIVLHIRRDGALAKE